ncbi:MAG: glycerol-3-phosphate 1-O-acyltransferase PlsY [Gammaproteobacteria bacterium]|nr:glycerol-3-phosphate 1-O-acyltransferase PlsY [Gammaproteobacteria bacterium]MDH5691686.1 glycerol-3-phosphate 1-O-acyltransferase PlsY [Gammaproteobacteria bacterium]
MEFSAVDYVLIIAGYLFGSIATAIVVSKLMGLPDPRTLGSGNPGATNVLRHGGKKAAAITLVGDCIKGVIPVLIAKLFTDSELVIALVAGAAFLGHLYPVFFGFRGGKGVATALGVFLAVDWRVGLATLGTWILAAIVTKISSLSALLASIISPLYMWWITGSQSYLILNILLTVLLVWRHRSNIRNLLTGNEDKIAGPDEEDV